MASSHATLDGVTNVNARLTGECLKLRRCGGATGRVPKQLSGLDHGFEPSMSMADYQSKVPLRTYEDLYEDYAHEVHPNYEGVLTGNRLRFITTSSGTTSGLLKSFR